jgi:hypothetical protein
MVFAQKVLLPTVSLKFRKNKELVKQVKKSDRKTGNFELARIKESIKKEYMNKIV